MVDQVLDKLNLQADNFKNSVFAQYAIFIEVNNLTFYIYFAIPLCQKKFTRNKPKSQNLSSRNKPYTNIVYLEHFVLGKQFLVPRFDVSRKLLVMAFNRNSWKYYLLRVKIKISLFFHKCILCSPKMRSLYTKSFLEVKGFL